MIAFCGFSFQSSTIFFSSWRVSLRIIVWDTAETLARKTAKRKALRFQFEKLVLQVQSSIENSETPRAKIVALKSFLEEVHFNLNSIDEEILNLCDEDEIEKETLESWKFEPYHFVMAELVSSLEKFHVVSLRSRSLPLIKSSCKLPKLELPKFSGNPMDWPGFWDQFQISIHSSSVLSDIDRFNYLKKYLCGSAAACVLGLTLKVH